MERCSESTRPRAPFFARWGLPGWPIPKRSESNALLGIDETGVPAVLGEQAEMGVIIETTPNTCVYSRLCGMQLPGWMLEVAQDSP